MSANSYAMDVLTRHQIYLQGYANGEVKKMLPFIRTMLKDVTARIGKLSSDTSQINRLIVLQQDLKIIIDSSMGKMNTALTNDLIKLGKLESDFTHKLLGTMITTNVTGTNLAKISSAITNVPMKLITGKTTTSLTINQAIKQFSSKAASSITRTIQTGIVSGTPLDEITDQVSRLVKGRTRAQAEALIRTSTNHASTQARNEVYKANSDVIEKEEFVATLDTETSLTCAGFDGKHFDVGQGAMPALHFNCRSLRIPIIRSEYAVKGLKGERASKGDDGAKPIGAKSTYGGWLRKQPASFQDDTLGKQRGALFRRGKLPIENFTNDKGIQYSLTELRALEGNAFERANL